MTAEDFQRHDVRIVASIVGVDSVIVAPVQSAADYHYDQIEWNRRFVEIYEQTKEHEWSVDYGESTRPKMFAGSYNRPTDFGVFAASQGAIAYGVQRFSGVRRSAFGVSARTGAVRTSVTLLFFSSWFDSVHRCEGYRATKRRPDFIRNRPGFGIAIHLKFDFRPSLGPARVRRSAFGNALFGQVSRASQGRCNGETC